MPHQINLLDAGLERRREPFGSAVALLAIAAAVILSVASAWGLQGLGAQASAQAAAAERDLADLQARVAALGPAAPSPLAGALARLRAVDADQRRMLAAIESNPAGAGERYSEYLVALSRQASSGLWLTGFGVSADGRALEVSGRMNDPRELPGYLKRLNAEPLFKGREFAQLTLKTVDAAASAGESARAAAGRAEFALRATPSGTALP